MLPEESPKKKYTPKPYEQMQYPGQPIQNQLSEDKIADQISMKEFIDPFTSEQTEKGDMPITQARLPGFQSAR